MKTCLRWSTFAGLVGAFSFVSAQTYQMTIIDQTLGGTHSYGHDMNDHGQIAGYSITAAGGHQAYVYSAGVMMSLPHLPGYDSTIAYGINNAGVVVGKSGARAFRYENGAMVDLGTVSGGESHARAISDNGTIVGNSTHITGSHTGFHSMKFEGGTMSFIGNLGGLASEAHDINSAGQIVGYSYDAQDRSRAFFYENGVIQDLGTLGGDTARAFAINEGGHVVGASSDGQGNEAAFLWSGGSMANLGGFPGMTIFASVVINDVGTIAGSVQMQGAPIQALIYRDGAFQDLNQFIDSPEPGWTVHRVSAINNHGQILALGWNGTSARPVILTPVPEPGTMAVVGAGLLILLRRRWRDQAA